MLHRDSSLVVFLVPGDHDTTHGLVCNCVGYSLQWRHNGYDGVSNHQSHDCLLKHLFRCRSKKTPKLASLAFVWGIHRWPVNSPHKWPVTHFQLMTSSWKTNGGKAIVTPGSTYQELLWWSDLPHVKRKTLLWQRSYHTFSSTPRVPYIIEPKTTWQQFCRRYRRLYFLHCIFLYSNLN